MSIVTARSPTTVNARIANGVSPSNATAPAVPLISAGRTKGANLRKVIAARATFSAPRSSNTPRQALDEHSDLVERDGEHVVQHERDAFCRVQSVENDLQRDPDGVGEQGFVLGIATRVGRDDRLGHERAERCLGT